MRFSASQRVISTGFLAFAIALTGCATTGAGVGSSAPADPNYDASGKRKAVIVKQTDRGAQITSDERILFDTGKAEIKGDGQVFIDRVAKILNDKTKANVVIEGHTDSVGGAPTNQALSVQRANAVRTALVAKGVPAARIQAAGFGLSRPVASNDTPDGRQTNRRTEIIVLGETVEKLNAGSTTSLGDSLSAGLDRFLQNAGEMMRNVFGTTPK